MFFRKLLGNNETKPEQKTGPPAGMQTMGANLQKRFSKGIQYNMKIIIKGDRNVGKSCLFQRLQGNKFKEEYIPTEEIQVASIMWNYKATDDIVKVEVWDVVDKGKKKKKIEGLKLDTSADGVFEDPCLDAEFIDVYKGTQGVILVMDITKQWTYEYVDRELASVPTNLPVLVIANHRDMGHHRTISEDQIQMMVESHHRPEGAAQIRFVETSMRNGYGLKYIHKFFNLPYLQLQRETLLKQLETNNKEMTTTHQELDLHEASEDQDYDLFLSSLTSKRRHEQERLSESAVQDARRTQDEKTEVATDALREYSGAKSAPTTPMAPTAAPIREAPPAKPIPGFDLSSMVKPQSKNLQLATPPEPKANSKSAPATPLSPPDTQPEQKASLVSRIFGGSKKPKAKDVQDVDLTASSLSSASLPAVRSVDDFAPDDALDASFLDDNTDIKMDHGHEQDSSSEDEKNPLVVSDQDDLDLDDIPDVSSSSATPRSSRVFSADLDLSSDEDERPIVTHDYQSELDSEKRKAKKASKKDSIVNGTVNKPSFLMPEQKRKSKKQSSSSSSRETSEEKDLLPPTLKSLSEGLTPDVAAPAREDSEDEDEDQNQVVVAQDIEDISEEETTTSSKPGDSGLATDTTVDNDGSSTSETKPGLGLEFEDLSIFEKSFDFNTGLTRNDSMTSDTIGAKDSDSSTKKKKKHKTKDRERTKDTERSHKKSKSKKSRESDITANVTGDSMEKRKKKKSKKQDSMLHTYTTDNQELEDFLGGPVSVDGGAYESL